MADPNCDCCNPAAVWEKLVAFLRGDSPTAARRPEGPVPASVRPPFLREPQLEVRQNPTSHRFQVGKPNYGIYDGAVLPSTPFTVIREFAAETDAKDFARELPRIRLPAKLVYEVQPNGAFVTLPAARQFDWRLDPDAQNTAARLQGFLTTVPLFATLPGSSLVKLNIARLPNGTAGQHQPDPANPTNSFVLVDPYQISRGMLQLCATYIHELTHGQFYHRRGFDNSELIPLLSRDDYLLVALDEELACFQNEVTSVVQFLATVPPGPGKAFNDWVETAIEAPAALYFATGLASMPPATIEDRMHKIVGDMYVLHYEQGYAGVRGGPLVPGVAANAWILSAEWTAIQATRTKWQSAGALP